MRKPNPGMILAAKKKFKLKLKKSYVVGDRDKDIIAGKKAKCRTILINKKFQILIIPLKILKNYLQLLKFKFRFFTI